MADKLEKLIQTSELKTDFLDQLSHDKPHTLNLHYDDLSDTLMLLFVPPETETFVHNLDENVAFLCKMDTREIVGLQIEDFEYSFLPKHHSVMHIWQIRETGEKLPEDLGDMIVAMQKMKPRIAQEILEAAEPILGQPAQRLKNAIQSA